MFESRIDAADQLVEKLQEYQGNKDAVILAIPRGGLEIGAFLRDKLSIPLDIVVTKKIGAPGNEEFAIGVVDPDGMAELNEKAISEYSISRDHIQNEIYRLTSLVKERYKDYRKGDISPPKIKDKTVILVDDGVATGFTTLAAVHYIRRHHPKEIILAIPVMPRVAYQKLISTVDKLICLDVHEDFYAVAQFYRDFHQVDDETAKALLEKKLDERLLF